MSNPITNSAAFATANMKPVPDEQIDALWGQNIADNTGYLFYRKIPCLSFGLQKQERQSEYHGTFFFSREPGMGSFMGSLSGSQFDVGGGGFPTFLFKLNGTTIFNQTFSAGTRIECSIGTSLVGISNSAMVPLTWSVTQAGANQDWHYSFSGWQTNL